MTDIQIAVTIFFLGLLMVVVGALWEPVEWLIKRLRNTIAKRNRE